jgi:ABC-type polysaccharide/polyol phosphate transport system ATPase subunit
VSSETPADRPTASSEDPAEARPRRAVEPGDVAGEESAERADHPTPAQPVGQHDEQVDELPHSPSTPVRLRDRLAQRARRAVPGDQPDAEPAAGASTSNKRWTWDLPPTSEHEQPDWSRPAAQQTPTRTGSSAELPESMQQLQAGDPTDLLPRTEALAGPAGTDPAAGAAPTDDFVGDVAPTPDTPLQVHEPKKPATPAANRSANLGKPDRPAKPHRPVGARKTGRGGRGGKELPGRQRFKLLQDLSPKAPRTDVPDQSHLPAEQRTDLAVRVTDLSITYRTSFEKKPTFRQAVVRLGRGQRAVREIKALQNISFEVRTGSSVGIIGRNGAGKSTLMRAMAGILPPTSGTVEVWGRASTLLALGVGFNNSLSGRENIILGGLAAGLPLDEVNERANEIADWTELGDFIDMPMRTYSSGMASRVAFAVAVHMEPDILMIDEGLSTGDAHFKDKASAKMAELRDRARAMFLVSHGLGSIKELCDEAIWIDKGHLMARGEPEEVIDQYLNHLNAKRRSTAFEDL